MSNTCPEGEMTTACPNSPMKMCAPSAPTVRARNETGPDPSPATMTLSRCIRPYPSSVRREPLLEKGSEQHFGGKSFLAEADVKCLPGGVHTCPERLFSFTNMTGHVPALVGERAGIRSGNLNLKRQVRVALKRDVLSGAGGDTSCPLQSCIAGGNADLELDFVLVYDDDPVCRLARR